MTVIASWAEVTNQNQKKTIRIKPLYEGKGENYDRIVVVPTHFNGKVFDGFITLEESNIIRKANGLSSEHYHGTTFDRSAKVQLSITFRLKRAFSVEEIKNKLMLNSHFWFEKTSKAGNVDKISGHTIYPMSVDIGIKVIKRESSEVKEIRIEGANYELKEEQIRVWLNYYGDVKSEIQEEAAVLYDKETGKGIVVGIGVYLVSVKLNRLIPDLLPIQGKKIRMWYSGVKKQCRVCFSHHENEDQSGCQDRDFKDYVKDFKNSNPELSPSMFLDFEDNNNSISNNDISISNCDSHGINEGEEDENLEQDYQKDEKDEQDEQETEIVYTDEDIITLLEDPKTISESERCWLCAQNCDTEEEVITKCKEMLKARNDPL